MGVGLLVAEEETLDEGALLELDFGVHLLHVPDSVVLVEFEGDLQIGQHLQAFLSVGNQRLLHS
jgi:hypothetical protein